MMHEENQYLQCIRDIMERGHDSLSLGFYIGKEVQYSGSQKGTLVSILEDNALIDIGRFDSGDWKPRSIWISIRSVIPILKTKASHAYNN